ncbi:EAL domain-containing protein [Escherichia coli]
MHYQPIVSQPMAKLSVLRHWRAGRRQTVVGCHQIVLFRWHSKRAFPEPLTLLIIRSVFEDMGDWLRQHPQQHISINLESTVLTSEKIPQLLREMINHYQVNPRQIALELTEREFADPKNQRPDNTSLPGGGP